MLLKIGSKGALVQELQEALFTLGYHPGPIDGLYGSLTEAALEKFQKSRKISVDGICGPSTATEINESLVLAAQPIVNFPQMSDRDPEPPSGLLGWVACTADKIPGRGGYTRVTLRSDAAESYNQLRKEVLELGGVLTSAGGRRGLGSKAGPTRSKKSMHYVGLAIDLALPTGLQDTDTDPYLIQMEDKRYWRVWCKTDNPRVPKVKISAAYVSRKNGKSIVRTREMECRAFDLTALFRKHGWERIRGRRSFFRGGAYGGAEWWHFQYEAALTVGISKFGFELLKVYPPSQAQRFVYWNESKNCIFGKNWF